MTAQDFNDDGELYESQLNRATRHILVHQQRPIHYNIPLHSMSILQRYHNISAILAQIKREENALRRTHKKGRVALTTAPNTHLVAAARPMADANAASQHAKAKGGKRAADHDADVETAPRRSLRLRASDQPSMEAATAGQEPSRAKKMRR